MKTCDIIRTLINIEAEHGNLTVRVRTTRRYVGTGLFGQTPKRVFVEAKTVIIEY